MFACSWRPPVFRIGKIDADRACRVQHGTKRAMQHAFPHGFQRALQHGIPHALQHGLQHFPQFSTMFLRASFARGNFIRRQEIRRGGRRCREGEYWEMLKNVEIEIALQPWIDLPDVHSDGSAYRQLFRSMARSKSRGNPRNEAGNLGGERPYCLNAMPRQGASRKGK